MEGFGVLELLKSLLEKPPQAEEKHGAGTAEKRGGESGFGNGVVGGGSDGLQGGLSDGGGGGLGTQTGRENGGLGAPTESAFLAFVSAHDERARRTKKR